MPIAGPIGLGHQGLDREATPPQTGTKRITSRQMARQSLWGPHAEEAGDVSASDHHDSASVRPLLGRLLDWQYWQGARVN